MGVFEALHEHFHDAGEVSALLVDSTIVRAHSCAAGAPRKRRTRCGIPRAELWRITTKLNLSLSDAWVPLGLILTPGHRNDITQASALIQGHCYKCVIGDKAYDSDAFREKIVSAGAVAVIPPRESCTDPRPYDQDLYKCRNIIERFFHRLKQYRRIATRYDKLAIRYLGFVYFAAILITAKKM